MPEATGNTVTRIHVIFLILTFKPTKKLKRKLLEIRQLHTSQYTVTLQCNLSQCKPCLMWHVCGYVQENPRNCSTDWTINKLDNKFWGWGHSILLKMNQFCWCSVEHTVRFERWFRVCLAGGHVTLSADTVNFCSCVWSCGWLCGPVASLGSALGFLRQRKHRHVTPIMTYIKTSHYVSHK